MSLLIAALGALSIMSFAFGLIFASICYGWQKNLILFLSFIPVVNIIMVAYIIWVDRMERKHKEKGQ